MLHDLISNIAIVACVLLMIGQVFNDNTFDSKQSIKNQILFGAIFGALGIILMLFKIQASSSVIVDLRNIAIICGAILSGPVTAVLAALIIGLFRVVYFGLNAASLAGFIVAIIIGLSSAIISRFKLSKLYKFIIMFVMSMLISNIGLIYLINDTHKLRYTLIYYWIIYIIGIILAYFSCDYIISANSNHKLMSYYRIKADNLSDLISSHKPGGEVKFISPQILTLFGYTTDEFIKYSSLEYIHPDDIQEVKNKFLNLPKDKNCIVLQFRMRQKNGTYTWVETSANIIRDSKGIEKEIICVTRDITKRKKGEQKLRISNARFRAIFDNAGVGIVLRDCDGNLIDANQTFYNMINMTENEASNIKDVIHPEDYSNAMESFNELVTGKANFNRLVVRCISKDNEIKYTDVTSTIVIDTVDGTSTIINIIHDITDKVRMVQSIRESEERFRSAFDNAMIGMCLFDCYGNFFGVNPALCSLLDYSENELIGINFSKVTHSEDVGKEILLCKQLLNGEIRNFILEKRFITKYGKEIWVILSVSMVHDEMDRPIHFIGQIQDITLRKQAEEKLKEAKETAERLASIDYLTGIMNRRAFRERFLEEQNRHDREGSSLSIVMADIDHFKKINDTYGHQIGDLVLQEFTKCLSSMCRPYDFLGRHGGEEFIVGLPNTTIDEALQIAERMRAAVEKLKINIPEKEKEITITASFGVTSSDSIGNLNLDDLILDSDNALYYSKQNGRNRVSSIR